MNERQGFRNLVRISGLSGAFLIQVAASAVAATAVERGALLAVRGDTCNLDDPAVIECGSAAAGMLTEDDCFEPQEDVFFDAWVFAGAAGSTVTIDLASEEFDTTLALIDPAGNVVALDDDGGGGTDAQIVHTLDTSGEWGIAAAGVDPSQLGNYTLSLDCSAPSVLSFLGGRFEVRVDWRRADGLTGAGTAVPLTDRSGLFYFFNPDNIEMLIKMFDACSLNGRIWVFYAATTNVELTVTVLDTATGQSKEYFNPLGTAAPPVQDTGALAVCPP
jgi:hypothetical protein